MKYLVTDSVADGLRIFVFPPDIPHDHMAAVLVEFGKPVNAGFVRVTPEGPVCFGESVSLGLKSGDNDTSLLRANFVASLPR